MENYKIKAEVDTTEIRETLQLITKLNVELEKYNQLLDNALAKITTLEHSEFVIDASEQKKANS